MADVNEKQVGGNHYKKARFQPWDWDKYGVGGHEWTAIKYITRYKLKEGKQDLEKAIHYIEKLAFEYSNNGRQNGSRRRPITELRQVMDDYVSQNELSRLQESAIWNIINWHNELSFGLIVCCIQDLIAAEYHTDRIQDDPKYPDTGGVLKGHGEY